MSLQLWLPMTLNLNNQGLDDVTVTNNGAIVDTNGKLGKCYSFGTSSSYLNLSNDFMKNMTTECSLSFWVNIISWNTNYSTFFQAGLGGAPWAHYIFGVLRNNNTSKLCFTISNGSTSSNTSYTTPTLSLDTWYHLTFVYKTGHCLIYVNGELYQDYETTIVPAFSSITKTTIGTCNNISSYQTNCKLNDVRVYNHALSSKEIKEISKGLICHYTLDNNGQGDDDTYTDTIVYDTSGNGHNGTITGTLTYNSDTAKYELSTVFNGTGSNYITAESLPSETKTISCWLKCPLGNVVAMIDYNSHLAIGMHNSTAFITYTGTTNGGTGSRVNIGSNWKADDWNHIVVIATGENTRDVYLNTVKLSPSSVNYWGHTTNNLMIGRRSSSSAYYNGQLSDFRAYATELSEADILELYKNGASIDNQNNIYTYEFKEVE